MLLMLFAGQYAAACFIQTGIADMHMYNAQLATKC